MSEEHLTREPHKIRRDDEIDIDQGAWWYEEPKGICVILRNGGQFYIRWSALKYALKRKEVHP